MSTVTDAFNQLGLVKWWLSPTQYFGQNGEMGTDFGMGGTGKPVGAITGGQVVYVGTAGYANDPAHSSLGYVVQVLAPDGRLFHYQHLKSPNVSVGQELYTGSVVGLSGGCPVGGYASDGQTCTFTDKWTTGQHIEVRVANSYNPNGGIWGQAWVNPLSTFIALAGGGATAIAGPYNNPTVSSSTGAGDWQSTLHTAGLKIGLFLVALVVAVFGLYLAFKPQADAVLHKAVKVGEVAAL